MPVFDFGAEFIRILDRFLEDAVAFPGFVPLLELFTRDANLADFVEESAKRDGENDDGKEHPSRPTNGKADDEPHERGCASDDIQNDRTFRRIDWIGDEFLDLGEKG